MPPLSKITLTRLQGRLKTRISPSNSIKISEINLGVGFPYYSASKQYYALTTSETCQHTKNVRTLCLRHNGQHRGSCLLLTENVCSTYIKKC